jgi:hypothetical protein
MAGATEARSAGLGLDPPSLEPDPREPVLEEATDGGCTTSTFEPRSGRRWARARHRRDGVSGSGLGSARGRQRSASRRAGRV